MIPSFPTDSKNPHAHAPARHLAPDAELNHADLRRELLSHGLRPEKLDDLMRHITERGWNWRLAGGGGNLQRFWAAIIVPWVGKSPWAARWASFPTTALAEALALAIASPPPKPKPPYPAVLDIYQ